MASDSSPARRVLAQKNANVSLSTRGNTSMEKTVSCASVTSAASVRAGQKRRHDELENHPNEPASSQTASTQTLSDGVEDLAQTTTTSFAGVMGSAFDTSGSNSTTTSSFHASQASMPPQEEQFEIHEEMSQRSLERLHATPIEESLSFSEPLPQPSSTRPSLTKDLSNLSQGSGKLSNYLDLNRDLDDTGVPPTNSDPRSDTDGDLHMLYPLPREGSKSPQEEQKSMLANKADILRTRLQLAIYKVQTNQTSKPFAYVLPPRAPSPDLPPAPLLPSQASRQYHFTSNQNTNINSPESKIAAARARATYQGKPTIRKLDSLPIPQIVPTGYSARMTDPHHAHTQIQIPNSPPPSHGHDMQISSALPVRKTPTKTTGSGSGPKPNGRPETPIQLSSPPGSDDDDDVPTQKPGTARRIAALEQRGLTSSVAKGEAASGLLELMKAAAS